MEDILLPPNNIPTLKLVEELGGVDEVAMAVGKSATTVHRAQYVGTFPASWYAAMCEKAGKMLPFEYFRFSNMRRLKRFPRPYRKKKVGRRKSSNPWD